MTIFMPLTPDLDPPVAAKLLSNLGFLSRADLPDRPGPAYLLVALRPEPTIHHYDPARVEYYVTVGGRGQQCVLTRDASMPVDTDFSWGTIRIVDRFKVSNEFLTFGGKLVAATIEDAAVAAFTSPAPLLRRGGHSQGWDHGAEVVGAFFGRLLVAVDDVRGFEARLAEASPTCRYVAFLGDLAARYRMSPTLRSGHPELWVLMDAETRRLRTGQPAVFRAGLELLAQMTDGPAAGH
jgi:hypothetical protein